MNPKPYTYVIVRKDIPLVQQSVQAGHAALEAGFRFKKPDDVSYLILLEVENQEELKKAASYLGDRDIDFYMFFEPDNRMGFSALCTRPIFEKREKSIFKKWKLYTPEFIAPVHGEE
jgi:hypothetical protein